jgi:hypothetical protein
MDGARCGYEGCPNRGEIRRITRIVGVGELTMIVDLCDSHYDLRDIDGDVIGWLKREWRKQAL